MSTIFIDHVHTDNTLQKMWERCEDENFCDVVLIAGKEKMRIAAHRSIISVTSEYFNGMFTTLMCESMSKEVLMANVDGEILKALIKFCYTGRIEINWMNVEDLLKTADMLLLENVFTACGKFLIEHLHPTNCLGFELLAEQYRCQPLLTQAKEYSLRHFREVCKTNEFLKLNAEQLGELLSNDNLYTADEEDVFNSLMSWIQHDKVEREKYRDEMLKKFVRMPLLEPSFLIDHVAPVCTSIECNQLFTKAIEWHLLPDRRSLSIPTKPRMLDQLLMAITVCSPKMYIHYFCPQRQQWMKRLKDLEYRSDYGSVLINDCIYFVGGLDDMNKRLNSVTCLNLKSMTLKYVTSINNGLKGFCVAELNGFLYIAGGEVSNGSQSSVNRFDPKSNAWTKVASMLNSRANFVMTQLNGKLYAVGSILGNNRLNSAECYDPYENIWTSIASINSIFVPSGIAVATGQLYVMGGSMCERRVYRYDHKKNKWFKIRDLSDNLCTNACTIFNDKIVVCYNDRMEEYNPEIGKWIVNASIKGLANTKYIFSYPNKIPKSEFVENY